MFMGKTLVINNIVTYLSLLSQNSQAGVSSHTSCAEIGSTEVWDKSALDGTSTRSIHGAYNRHTMGNSYFTTG